MGFISLEEARLIGKGSSRRCYQHPADQGKCVKVQKNPARKITSEELKYYRKLMRHRISWEMVARYHETVLTDQGPGAVFEMPLDFDGTVSRTLHYYLLSDDSADAAVMMVSALLDLKRYLLSQNIIVRELKAENLVWCRMADGYGRFILIDGIGNNQLLPIASYFKRFGRRVICRKWATFERDLGELFSGSLLARELVSHL
ncbi:MAG: hypothetical protein K9G39_03295 [Chlorobium sp.]|uniref:YrbL family protein n=1 Tax=Chlorobium sp. TaxID=1095 RepID=UPI0025BB748B|nr:YrbL family protein [Chlorobium sp.]MCF8382609.1 hypothetical protein [Chlorobium sp.]